MKPVRLLLSPLAGLVSVALFAADARSPAKPLVESVDVEVVNVDVIVTGKDGQAVNGLTAADFELFEDGDRREITNFFAFDEGHLVTDRIRVGQQVSEAPAEALTRRMAILFDSNSLIQRDRDRAVEAVERFIEEQFDGSYEWAIVAYDSQIRLLQPFSSDKLSVLAALSRLKDLPLPVARFSGSNKNMLTEQPGEVRTFERVRSFDGRGVGAVSTQDFEARERILDNMQRLKATAAATIETMRAYSGLSGRKSVVMVTGVLESLPSGAQVIGGGFPGAGQDSDRADPMLMSLHSDLQLVLASMVQTANASGFSIYPISALGFAASQAPHMEIERQNSPYSDSFNQNPTSDDTESAPRILADGTGGKYFSTSKYYEAFDELDSRTANAYVLGFRTVRSADRKYHDLKVKVKRPGVTVSAREGYLHMTVEDRLMESLATPLAFPKDRGDIPVQVAATIEDGGGQGEKRAVTVSGLVPLRELTLIPNSANGSDGRVNLYLAVYNEEGKLVDLVKAHQDLAVDQTKLAAAAADPTQVASFALRLKLDRGAYTLSLTMMDEVTTRYGTGLERLAF